VMPWSAQKLRPAGSLFQGLLTSPFPFSPFSLDPRPRLPSPEDHPGFFPSPRQCTVFSLTVVRLAMGGGGSPKLEGEDSPNPTSRQNPFPKKEFDTGLQGPN
jgi:hypothetical protein